MNISQFDPRRRRRVQKYEKSARDAILCYKLDPAGQGITRFLANIKYYATHPDGRWFLPALNPNYGVKHDGEVVVIHFARDKYQIHTWLDLLKFHLKLGSIIRLRHVLIDPSGAHFYSTTKRKVAFIPDAGLCPDILEPTEDLLSNAAEIVSWLIGGEVPYSWTELVGKNLALVHLSHGNWSIRRWQPGVAYEV